LLDDGERIAWGAKTIPEGGLLSLPKRLHAPGLLLCGDGPGFVNVPALKGIHYAIETGSLAAEAAFAALQRGEAVGRHGALASYDEAVRQSFVWRDLEQVRNMRQAFGRGFWVGGALAGAMTASRGGSAGDTRTKPDADQELIRAGRARNYPTPDGKLVFDKLSSVFLSGNKTRDDAPSHIRVQTVVPAEVAELWTRMCPAQVYEPTEGGVEVTASNCVQCAAITAHAGRLSSRGRLRARIHTHLTTSAGLNVLSSSDQTRNLEPRLAETCRVKNPWLPLTLTAPTATQLPPPQRWSR
jgi:electron-transferring-flavoprotein dehydrogenase